MSKRQRKAYYRECLRLNRIRARMHVTHVELPPGSPWSSATYIQWR